jgi:hypothetical protein
MIQTVSASFWWFLVPKYSSRIVSASSNNSCSALNRPREVKLVFLELPGNEDSEYIFKTFLAYLGTKWQCKMFGNTIFQSLGGGQNWPTEVVEIVTLHAFDEKDRFFITSCDAYMGHSHRLLYTFHHKKT